MPLEVGVSPENKPWIANRNYWTNDCIWLHVFEKDEFFDVFNKLKEIYGKIKPNKRKYTTKHKRLKRIKVK